MIEIDGGLYRLDDIIIARPVKGYDPQLQVRRDLGTHSEIMVRGEVWTTVEVSYASLKEMIREAIAIQRVLNG